MSPAAYSIAIIGMGPRGLSVLERLILGLRKDPLPGDIDIWVIDDHQHGAGRIWRTSQSEVFQMNTVAEQVTLYSYDPAADATFERPSLLEWLHREPTGRYRDFDGNQVCSRRLYGEYLTGVLDTLVRWAPPGCRVQRVTDRAVRLEPRSRGYNVWLERQQGLLEADKVVLATGHSTITPSLADQELVDFALRHPGLRFLASDSAADMDLDSITSADVVAVKGMGLSFYDVMAAFTLGRGGTFVRDDADRLRYRPSGEEPSIVAGSRSGLPTLARGRNQKGLGYRFRGLFLTREAIARLRMAAERQHGSAQLDFARDVEPLLRREVEHVYLSTTVRLRYGGDAASSFSEAYRQSVDGGADPQLVALRFGVGDIPPFSLESLARPFENASFETPGHFAQRLVARLGKDLEEAAKGNVDGPLKAALDTLRDVRSLICEVVNYGGLEPQSHRDFLSRFAPMVALLSTGPPAFRIEQLVALLECGLLTIVGPDTRFAAEEERHRFSVWSPRVTGSRRDATVMLDARIPTPHLRKDTSVLMQQMLEDGLVSEFVNQGSGAAFPTGGVAVTELSHVIDAHGNPLPDLYAIGIPTEHTRWFTQVGSSRPAVQTSFSRDAAVIVDDILSSARGTRAAHRAAITQ